MIDHRLYDDSGDLVGRFPSGASVVLSVLLFISRAEATCNEEQINSCRQAGAVSGRLEALRSSGECMAKRYMEFSHLCSVTNYLPTVDYCCCRHHEDTLLCCRYHQDWNRFRCQEADDVIHTRGVGPKGALVDFPPLEILLPSTLVPLVLLAMCCLMCLVTCCLCRRRQHRHARKTPEHASDRTGCDCGGLIQDGGCFEGLTRKQKKRDSQKKNGSSAVTRNTAAGSDWSTDVDSGADHSRSMSPNDDDEEAQAAASAPLNPRCPATDESLRPLSVSRLYSDPSLVPCYFSPDHHHHHCRHHHHHFVRFTPAPTPPAGPALEPSAPPAADDSIPAVAADDDGVYASYPVGDLRRACVEPPSSACALGDDLGRGVYLCSACSMLQPPPPYDESLSHRVV